MSRQLVIDVARSSSWRRLYSFGFILAVILVVMSTDLAFSYIAIIVAMCLLNYILIRFYRHSQLLHITGNDIDEVDGYWQLLIQGRHEPVLWEAKLVSSKGFFHCVQLNFETQQPLQKPLKILIWQDQVTAATWRELKVLTRWSK